MSIVNPSGRAPIVTPVRGFDARIVGGEWGWAAEHRAEIAAYWDAARRRNPRLFDGRVLIANRVAVRDGVLRSDHIEIPFSALDYWRSLSFPDCGAFNLFAAGVVVSADDAVLLGRMGPQTANAGHVYFPAGTPDLDDVAGDRLDLDGSILRELEEETGLGADAIVDSGLCLTIQDAGLLCCARRFDCPLTGEEIEARVAAHIAGEAVPELDRAVLARRPDETVPGVMPAYVRAALQWVLA